MTFRIKMYILFTSTCSMASIELITEHGNTVVFSSEDATYRNYPTTFHIRDRLADIFNGMTIYTVSDLEFTPNSHCTGSTMHYPIDFTEISDSGFLEDPTVWKKWRHHEAPLSTGIYEAGDPFASSDDTVDDDTVDDDTVYKIVHDHNATKSADFLFSDYSVITWDTPKAGVPIYNGKNLRLHKANRVDFCLGNDNERIITHLDDEFKDVPPTKGVDSLVCVLHPTNEYRGLRWFVVSHQFYRLYTLVTQGPSHPIFAKHKDLFAWLWRSTNLATNGYRKWALGYLEHGFVPPPAEIEDRFWRVRTEWCSRDYSHIYLALALMSVSGDMPLGTNLPRGGKATPPALSWDLPETFLYNVAAALGWERSRLVHVPICDVLLRSMKVEADPQLAWIEDTEVEV